MFLAKGFVFLCAASSPCVHRCLLTKFDYGNGKPVSTNWSSSVPYKNSFLQFELGESY